MIKVTGNDSNDVELSRIVVALTLSPYSIKITNDGVNIFINNYISNKPSTKWMSEPNETTRTENVFSRIKLSETGWAPYRRICEYIIADGSSYDKCKSDILDYLPVTKDMDRILSRMRRSPYYTTLTVEQLEIFASENFNAWDGESDDKKPRWSSNTEEEWIAGIHDIFLMVGPKWLRTGDLIVYSNEGTKKWSLLNKLLTRDIAVRTPTIIPTEVKITPTGIRSLFTSATKSKVVYPINIEVLKLVTTDEFKQYLTDHSGKTDEFIRLCIEGEHKTYNSTSVLNAIIQDTEHANDITICNTQFMYTPDHKSINHIGEITTYIKDNTLKTKLVIVNYGGHFNIIIIDINNVVRWVEPLAGSDKTIGNQGVKFFCMKYGIKPNGSILTVRYALQGNDSICFIWALFMGLLCVINPDIRCTNVIKEVLSGHARYMFLYAMMFQIYQQFPIVIEETKEYANHVNANIDRLDVNCFDKPVGGAGNGTITADSFKEDLKTMKDNCYKTKYVIISGLYWKHALLELGTVSDKNNYELTDELEDEGLSNESVSALVIVINPDKGELTVTIYGNNYCIYVFNGVIVCSKYVATPFPTHNGTADKIKSFTYKHQKT